MISTLKCITTYMFYILLRLYNVEFIKLLFNVSTLIIFHCQIIEWNAGENRMKVRKFRTFVDTITLYFQLFYSVMCSLNNELLTNYLGNFCSLGVQELFLSYICCTTKCPFQKIKYQFSEIWSNRSTGRCHFFKSFLYQIKKY